MPPWVIGVVVVAIVAFILLGGEGDEKDVKERINQFAGPEGLMDDAVSFDKKDTKKAAAKPTILTNLGVIFQRLTPKDVAKGLQDRIERADLPLRANEFAAVIFLSACVGFVIGAVLYRSKVAGIGFFVLGAMVPLVYLRLAAWRRLSKFNDQLLDTLLLLSNAVKAGYSLLQAVEMIARESPPPMGKEFQRVIRETTLGITPEDALLNLKLRVPSDDLDLMVTVILIQRQIGGNLSEILDSIGHTIRERQRIMGMVRTLTSQGRMSGAVIGGMPFALAGIIGIINPKYISLLWTYDDGVLKGYYLIILGLIMEGLGFYVILSIVDIEV